MGKILQRYFKTSLVLRIFIGFLAGSAVGIAFWYLSRTTSATAGSGSTLAERVIPCIMPFGEVFVHMLKMIVVPIIFFSLVTGASNLPIKRFGHIGVRVIAWYLATSLFATVLGTGLALAINPGSGTDLGAWQKLVQLKTSQTTAAPGDIPTQGTLSQILLNLFRNPFEALADGNFLPIIVFAILFGLAIRVMIESGDAERAKRLAKLTDLIQAALVATF